jgi:hypothetical protein
VLRRETAQFPVTDRAAESRRTNRSKGARSPSNPIIAVKTARTGHHPSNEDDLPHLICFIPQARVGRPDQRSNIKESVPSAARERSLSW